MSSAHPFQSPAMQSHGFQSHAFQTDDHRLYAIADKVLAQERLSADDALTLYRSADILAVGWLANSVRERMHGDKTYFNVNRHLNPTNEVIHVICIPAIVFSLYGLLWLIHPFVAMGATVASLLYYFMLSVPFALGTMLISGGMLWAMSVLSQEMLWQI